MTSQSEQEERVPARSSFFFFNDTATTEIYTLSLHDALPIFRKRYPDRSIKAAFSRGMCNCVKPAQVISTPLAKLLRSEEHTSELQSRQYLVCRLLLEKKKYTQLPLFNIFRLPSSVCPYCY